jgi:hypothetical protein
VRPRPPICTGRPEDSSARFLTLEKSRQNLLDSACFWEPTEVMNVWTANHQRQRRIMATFTIDSENNIVAHTSPPAGFDESQSFSTPKELAKLTVLERSACSLRPIPSLLKEDQPISTFMAAPVLC